MSGHSKWSKIKRQKKAEDIKKGQLFTKLGRAITLAVREGGANPDMNFALRMALDNAKASNMPKDTIERAIKKGTGEGGGGDLEKVSYEAVGKGGIALIIDCVTDNTNRTIANLRKVLEEYGFEISPGGAKWQFTRRGKIVVRPEEKVKVDDPKRVNDDFEYKRLDKEDVILEVMDIEGVLDVRSGKNEDIEIITEADKLNEVNNALEESNLNIRSMELVRTAKNPIRVEEQLKKKAEDLIEGLDALDDTANIWTNLK